MFTDCPDCARQFRIHAEQLSAANGQVRCGYCGKQFNALERLHDSPLPETELLPVQDTDEKSEIHPEREPQFDISIAENELAIDSLVAMKVAGEPGSVDADILFNDIAEVSAELEARPADSTTRGQYDKENDEAGTDAEPVRDTPDGLAELLSDHLPRRSLAGRMLWGLATLLVAMLVVVQAAWYHRDELMYRYPVLVPWVQQLCERLDCETIRRRDVSAITLLNRDVRFHPRFADALLVNATMTNLSQGVQPFPRIQLTLFDTGGNVIAYREFNPADYLDDSIGIEEGMAPDFPIHFVLEITGPSHGAVSFEFRFL
ncbi:MAG: hypothetical protein A2W28_01510 [Gammaproteobacteria bacterium RBG_16_51_14]|nr:MAG: hypothetical protein A2W28_01510 [Gammaproteobacteria bacterium RBG_16_51_14]